MPIQPNHVALWLLTLTLPLAGRLAGAEPPAVHDALL